MSRRCVDPGCGVLLVAARRGLRTADLPPGHGIHHSRGLCKASYQRARHRGELHRYSRVYRTRDEVLETWQALRRPRFDYGVAQVAEVLGMTVPGLEWVLAQARGEGDPRAVPGRDTRWPSGRSAVDVPTGWQWSNAQLFDLCTLDEGETA